MSQIVSPITTSALSFLTFFVTVWRNAGIHFLEDLLFHDLITQYLLGRPPTWDRCYGDY